MLRHKRVDRPMPNSENIFQLPGKSTRQRNAATMY